MAVTPVSLITLSTNELATITRIESVVDAELRLKYEVGKPVAVRNVLIRPILEENPSLLLELKNRFVATGWDIVEYNSEQGIWLSFSAT